MHREQKCKYCLKYFTYDDGLVDLGLGGNTKSDVGLEARIGFCPACNDPNYVYDLSYKKEMILWVFKKYLQSRKIDTSGIPDDSLIEMMRNFPRMYRAYTSNGTYRTITLFPGTRFEGEYGEFELGISFERNPEHRGIRRVWYNRYITCIRCNTKTVASFHKALYFYLGLLEKRCQKCDITQYYPNGKRDTSGLKRAGAAKSEYSDRALAKALNVSRMDYRRNKDIINKPVPALPIGTVVGVYEILAAYWDEDPKSYSPKYLVRCIDCKQEFRVIQKTVQYTQHWCEVYKRVR